MSISSGFSSTQDLLGISGQSGTSGTVNGLSWSYNSGTGVLTLTGSATASTYQTALSQVVYSNSSENPSSTPRSIAFALNLQEELPLAALHPLFQ